MTSKHKTVLEMSRQTLLSVSAKTSKCCHPLRTRLDCIVVGAGSSGSVVAGRLASDSNIQVLLLEAGGSDETELVTNPTRWPMTLGSELDWGFMAEPNPQLMEGPFATPWARSWEATTVPLSPQSRRRSRSGCRLRSWRA